MAVEEGGKGVWIRMYCKWTELREMSTEQRKRGDVRIRHRR